MNTQLELFQGPEKPSPNGRQHSAVLKPAGGEGECQLNLVIVTMVVKHDHLSIILQGLRAFPMNYVFLWTVSFP